MSVFTNCKVLKTYNKTLGAGAHLAYPVSMPMCCGATDKRQKNQAMLTIISVCVIFIVYLIDGTNKLFALNHN